MKRIISFFAGLFLFSVVPMVRAQTPAPMGYPFSVSGSYAASSGNATNNGMQNTVEWTMGPHWGPRIDMFGLNTPSQTTLSLAEGQYKIKAQTLFKTTNPQLQNVVLGVHAGLGTLKSPTGALSLAVGAGLSADYNVNSIFFVRVFDLTYAYSRGLGNNGIVVGNYVSAGAGFGFRF